MQERNIQNETSGPDVREFTLNGGCVVCGGSIDVRVTPGSIRGYCAPCGWISRPLLWQSNGQVSIVHPPLASA
jgi:hypothetical protein